MKALVFDHFQGEMEIRKVPDPEPKADGVVLRTLATGICRSDWHGWMGHDPDIVLPHVPGHELAGEIVAVGKEVKNFKEGERVTVPFVCGCGHCEQCTTGNQQVCDHQSQPGFTHWGSFADFVRIDNADTNLVRLPSKINNETAAALGCRFITAYRAVVDQGQVQSGQYIAVHGCGGVGLSAIMIAKAFHAQVIAIDINADALSMARQLGADYILNPKKEARIIEAVKAYTNGGAHLSFDALGSSITCENSIGNLRKRGKHIQVGLMTGEHQFPKIPMDQIIANELEIIGSHGMQAHRYPDMLSRILDGELHPEKLIEKTITLYEAGQVLKDMAKFQHYGMTIINSF